MDCLLDLGFKTRLALLMNFFKPLGSSFFSPGAPWPEEDIVFGNNCSKEIVYGSAMKGDRRGRFRSMWMSLS